MFHNALRQCPVCGAPMEQGFSVRNQGLSWVSAKQMQQIMFIDTDLNGMGYRQQFPARAAYNLSYHCWSCKLYSVDYSRGFSRAEATSLAEVCAMADRSTRTAAPVPAVLPYPHTESMALVDSTGAIQYVNPAWMQFGHANDGVIHDDAWTSVNYLAVCDAAATGATDAQHAADGIRRVLRQAVPSFAMDYPCHSRSERRWYRMAVTPLQLDGASYGLIMHQRIDHMQDTRTDL